MSLNLLLLAATNDFHPTIYSRYDAATANRFNHHQHQKRNLERLAAAQPTSSNNKAHVLRPKHHHARRDAAGAATRPGDTVCVRLAVAAGRRDERRAVHCWV